MSYSQVEVQIMKQMDKFAKVQQLYSSVDDSGTEFWWMIDAASNQTYENRCKTSSISTMDDTFADGNIASTSTNWFLLHEAYFSNGGYVNTAGYLTSKRFRVNEDFAETYYEVNGTRLDAKYIFADGLKTDNELAKIVCATGKVYTITFGGSATATSKTLDTNFGDTPFGFTIDTALGNNLYVNMTLGDTAGNVTAYSDLLLTSSLAASSTYSLGECSFTAVAGSTTLTLTPNTTPINFSGITIPNLGFKVGGYVVLQRPVGYTTGGSNTDPTDLQTTFDTIEYGLISSLNSSASTITLSAATRHHYPSGSFVRPVFNKITAMTASGSSLAESGQLRLVPINDRPASLTP